MATSKVKHTRRTKRTEPLNQAEAVGEGKLRIVKALLLSNLVSVVLFGLRRGLKHPLAIYWLIINPNQHVKTFTLPLVKIVKWVFVAFVKILSHFLFFKVKIWARQKS